MDNKQISTALQTYFNINDPQEALSITAINSIDYYDLLKFGNDIINNYINGVLNRQHCLFDTLKFLNEVIDIFRGEKICNSVNVSILTYLYDVIYTRNIEAEHNQRIRNLVKTIMEKKDYSKIVKTLYKRKSATPSELAFTTGLSIQKVVSCVKSLGELAIKVVRSPFNNRKVTYCLHADLYNYLTRYSIYTTVAW